MPENAYLWAEAFCESFHATQGGAKLDTTAIQKHTQQGMSGTWIWYQLKGKITASKHSNVFLTMPSWIFFRSMFHWLPDVQRTYH